MKKREELLADIAKEKKYQSIIDIENISGRDGDMISESKISSSKGLPPELLAAFAKLPKKKLLLSLHGPMPAGVSEESYKRNQILTKDVPPMQSQSTQPQPQNQNQSQEQIIEVNMKLKPILYRKSSAPILPTTNLIASSVGVPGSRSNNNIACDEFKSTEEFN